MDVCRGGEGGGRGGGRGRVKKGKTWGGNNVGVDVIVGPKARAPSTHLTS